jgi:hypothetical protein
LRSGVLEDVEVRRLDVAEAALVQPLEHPLLHGFPGQAQERADQGRPEWGFCRSGFHKVI